LIKETVRVAYDSGAKSHAEHEYNSLSKRKVLSSKDNFKK